MASSLAEEGMALLNMRMSSANMRWKIGRIVEMKKIGLMVPTFTSLEIFKLKNPWAKMKRKGDSGSPFLNLQARAT